MSICQVLSLKCDVCKKEVKDYKRCISTFVYCDIDCLEKLFMNHLKLCNGGYRSDDDRMSF